jgi:4-hydroxythreonine-4-phosphate dehydrogenase
MSKSSTGARLAITMGDPAGVGPEIVVKSLSHAELHEAARPIVVGDLACLRAAAELTGSAARFAAVTTIAAGPPPGTIEVVDLANVDQATFQLATASAAGGRAAHEYLEQAAILAREGSVDGIVTAPLNKAALSLAGWGGVGHTELLAGFCGVPTDRVAMMLAGTRLRIVHTSTHVSLRRAIELVQSDRIIRMAHLGGAAVAEIIGHAPRIAIAGLNPHAGESGLFGSEEEAEILPAIEALRSDGWQVEGPVPPDTVFMRALQGTFDLVVAMYHDQGHIPSKLSGLVDTVNVTLGLPIIRTSVDHGTAFDIAGTGTADETNLVQAYRVAARMAASRRSRLASSR